jgi:hypothetical protein
MEAPSALLFHTRFKEVILAKDFLDSTGLTVLFE